jgi:hypothetical protein
LPVELLGPPADAILRNTDYKLSWYPTTDPNVGDYVVYYEIQIADNTNFVNPAVDDVSIVLGDDAPTGGTWAVSMRLDSFAGHENLVNDTLYYWRVRARDNWGDYGDWSTENLWFNFGTPPPNVTAFEMHSDGSITINWESTGTGVYIEYIDSLISSGVWQIIEGPIYGTDITITPPSELESGFYRVRVE